MDILLKDEVAGALVKQLNPNFQPPSRPFMRLSYVEAIKWLNDHGIQYAAEDADGNIIKDENGQPKMVDHAVGDDIAEAAERQMTDIIGTPVFLHGFPAELKAFYMKKIPGGEGGTVLTESCDLLMPNVGEIVGMSFLKSHCSSDVLTTATTCLRWFYEDNRYGGTVGGVQTRRHRSFSLLLVQ